MLHPLKLEGGSVLNRQ